MEVLVKKYFWLINLVFLLLGAWLLSAMVNVVAAHKLRSLPTVSKASPKISRRRASTRLLENNQVIVDLNLFGSDISAKLDTSLDGPSLKEPADLSGEGVESSLNAGLIGTIVANDKTWSMAIITDQDISETGIYRIDGDLMGEASVLAIQSQRVIINHNGTKEYLELQEKAQPKVSSRFKNSRSRRHSSSSSMEGVQQIGENSYRIERSEIDKTLSNLNSIAMQARIVPSFKNGKSNGFKLFAIRPGSVYSKLGIKNGDVIHKINGYPMNSPEKALEIYQKLKTARSIDIELSRRNNKKNLKYQIE